MLNEAVNQATTKDSEGWNTPQKVIDLVRQVAPIALDPCSNEGSLVEADRTIALPEDGLDADWWACSRLGEFGRASAGLVYVNPPYGSGIGPWLAKCAHESRRGCEVIALVPARTDAKWFQCNVFACAQAICFWAGRLRFEGAPSSAPFPSALAYYGTRSRLFREVFAPHGTVVTL